MANHKIVNNRGASVLFPRLFNKQKGTSDNSVDLELKPGINTVDDKTLKALTKHPVGRGLFEERQLEMYSAPPELPKFDDDAPKVATPKAYTSKAADGKDAKPATETGEGAAPEGDKSSAGAAAPSLELDAIAAVEFIEACDDPKIVVECWEQETRVTVKAACEKRAEELATKAAA